jgi:hypothetical protein
MHKNLKWLPHIEGASLKFKNQTRFLFRPMCIHTGQKTGPKISCDSPFMYSKVLKHAKHYLPPGKPMVARLKQDNHTFNGI